jgi:hypothetical protein
MIEILKMIVAFFSVTIEKVTVPRSLDRITRKSHHRLTANLAQVGVARESLRASHRLFAIDQRHFPASAKCRAPD